MRANPARGVVVVAHPDDESMWCGGLLARYRDCWTVICCSIPRIDPIRAYKFFEACEVLGARGRLLPFTETDFRTPIGNLSHLDLSGYDTIVTHNALGEYGHRHHMDLHKHIVERWRDKVMTIGYGDSSPPGLTITLTEEEHAVKMAAIKCYNHVSPTDGRPKWEALLARYGEKFNMGVETYTCLGT